MSKSGRKDKKVDETEDAEDADPKDTETIQNISPHRAPQAYPKIRAAITPSLVFTLTPEQANAIQGQLTTMEWVYVRQAMVSVLVDLELLAESV